MKHSLMYSSFCLCILAASSPHFVCLFVCLFNLVSGSYPPLTQRIHSRESYAFRLLPRPVSAPTPNTQADMCIRKLTPRGANRQNETFIVMVAPFLDQPMASFATLSSFLRVAVGPICCMLQRIDRPP